ncbi:frizzled-10-like [Vanessa tameamea]|uniref:Frizzled-10-like n=1 Tax=Vanessa tameamea TaxID=334116 RepID=A0A8B8IFK3_VANTA|nr:frizzled-10-like [Vanessa tameamea]XP_047535392.1 frizzled-10-like isoform X1 [Vanessa atalanta]
MMGRFLCIFLLVWMVAADQEEVEGGKCERIKLSQCQDLGYNWTAMPNLMGHRDQKEAEEAMTAFTGILASECSVHARFLLCSAFAPLCSEQVSGSVSACRALCEKVVEDCKEQIKLLPPSIKLDCSAFPLRPDRRLCMRPPNASELESEPPPLPRWPFHDQELREHGCPPAYTRAPTGECWPACGQHARYTQSDKRTAEIWMITLAWFSLLSTSFALLTFCAEPSRYRYPERPVVWMATCHAIVALAHVTRGWLGAKTVSCSGTTLAVDGLASPTCVAFFSLTYYFTLAADAWFANACVAWYLTAASEWSTEALERAAAYLHAVAWGWAGAWTAAALALRRVTAEELTGTCGVSDTAAAALIGVPRGALLITSIALAIGACPGIMRVRRALDSRGARRVGRLAARAAAGGLLYLLLAAFATGTRVIEARKREAQTNLALLAALEAGNIENTVGSSGVSICLWLSCGIAAGAWAWSRKTAVVWKKALCPPRKAPCCAPPLLRPQHPYYKRPLHVSRV